MFGNNDFKGSPEFGYVMLYYSLLKEISTGKDNNNNTAVITTAQPNKASFAPQIISIWRFLILTEIKDKTLNIRPTLLR